MDIKRLIQFFNRKNNGSKENQPVQTWRDSLPENLNTEINELVKDTYRYRDAYKKTFNVKNAQMWCAIAELSQRIRKMENHFGTRKIEEKPE